MVDDSHVKEQTPPLTYSTHEEQTVAQRKSLNS
jgi:hypothetical protein